MRSRSRQLRLLPAFSLTLTVAAALIVLGLEHERPAAPAPVVSRSTGTGPVLPAVPDPALTSAPVPPRPEVGFPVPVLPRPEVRFLAPVPPQPEVKFLAPRPPEVLVSLPPPDTFALREDVAVELSQVQMGRVHVALLRGGQPVSRHVLWRSSVGEFIRAAGAVAGVNGTFFKDAAIASNDSNMLGPMLTPDGHFLSETDPVQLKKIGGRPLVAWSRSQFLVTEFDPASMNHKAQVQALLPGMTDAFLAGGWLVHGGHALSTAQMMRHAPKDAQEVRPRVFFGVTRDGRVIAGATISPVSSTRLAQVAEQAGALEAVLMDSGYSTSLIYGTRVLAVGHRTRRVASRPVPHAIVFMNPVLAVVKASKP